MPPQIVKYSATGGDLLVEVSVGNLVFGHYLVKSRIPPNAPVTILDGSNLHPTTQTFTPSDGQGVSWDVVLNKLPGGDSSWTVTVSLRQNGATIYTAPYTGQFTADTSVPVSGGVLLVAS